MVSARAGILADSTTEFRVGHHQHPIPKSGMNHRLTKRHEAFSQLFEQPFMVAELIGMRIEAALRHFDHAH